MPPDESIMRNIAVAALFAVCASAALAESPARPSQLLCDASKIGARELAECLKAAADKSDRELASTMEAAVKSIDTRPKMLSTQRARWRHSLNDAQSQWISWRDSECQDVAPFEAGMGAKGGDPRLSCIIDQDARRVADIKARYP
jgi:uncharacterized protein YecT (DUF1311 family)